MTSIAERLHHIRTAIADAAKKHHRYPHLPQLLAVSKTHSAAQIKEAYDAGQKQFGENYLQEAREKQTALSKLDIEWHFIGPIQSNKTRDIAENFSWVHSVDRLKIAKRLSEQRPDHLPDINLCIQVNIDDETSKSGAKIEDLDTLANAIHSLPKLNLRGLMAIPAKRDNPQEQQLVLESVAKAMQQLAINNNDLNLDTLSMGMSADLEPAIAAGSTIVRIGSAIFGPREPSHND